jgi:hypothetical protein
MEVLKGNWGYGGRFKGNGKGRFKGNGEERIKGNEERKR